MAERIIDMSTDDLGSLIDEYNGYKEDVEDEISEIDGELDDLESESGEAIESIRESLRELKVEYESSLEELEELLGILQPFYANVLQLVTEDGMKLTGGEYNLYYHKNIITENINVESISEHIKINADIIEDELFVKLDELFDDFKLESSWFESFKEQKITDFSEIPNLPFIEPNSIGMPYSNQSDKFYELHYQHVTIKNISINLKNEIEGMIDSVKVNGNIILDLFGELDTLEKLTENFNIDSDDYIRYNNAGKSGSNYNFDINNLDVGLENMLNDETRYSIILDEIGDGTLNEQINEAWTDVILNDDYSKLISIYESIGDYPEYSDYILGRLQQIQYNTAVSISSGIIVDYMNKGIDEMEVNSHLYTESEALYLKSLQLSFFSSEFPNVTKDDACYSINFDNFNTDGMHISGNVLVQTAGNDAILNGYLDYEFSVEQYSSYMSNEENKDYAFKQDSDALKNIFISLSGEVKYIGSAISAFDTTYSLLSNVYELFSDQEFEELYLKNYGYAFNSKIDSNVYLEPHYALIYMDIVKNKYPILYDFYTEMNYNIDKYGYKETAEMDLESKYDMERILFAMNSAEADTLSIVSNMDVSE